MDEFLGGRTRFIITSELEDCVDTGSIMDNDGEIVAYFEHMHSWKTRNGPEWWRNKKQALTTDIQLVGIDETLLGEIHEIPPPMMSRIIRKWEIYNSKKELEGVVREKPEFIGSSWVLENLEGKVIATIKGNRTKKDYKILTKRNETIARCYRSEKIDKKSYYVETKRSKIDLFLVLSYIIVLDLAKTGWVYRETGVSSNILIKYIKPKTALTIGCLLIVAGLLVLFIGKIIDYTPYERTTHYYFPIEFYFGALPISFGIAILLFLYLPKRLEERIDELESK